MTKARRRAVGKLAQALGFDGGGDHAEPGHGDPYALVPRRFEGEALELLRQLRRMKGVPEHLLDAPAMAPRVVAEGESTARGRKVVERFSRELERHRELLRATAYAPAPWASPRPSIDFGPADYEVVDPSERRHLGLLP